ncbi:thioredoxin domain-containing protein [Cryobacterium frigoriphilum]|uniref:Thioredoxin domain-containing protein n=1 Tax=Cryobacterium frigoriphilum TaxID=1259150 RepID=A0A4R9A117_9MICO|nr:thioredoxin domain-containing protein [Cryobacterium frigoriphilum]TFD50190.1 thioredoxin domain-containing protein [Cryobacterium frigoriphilum]
MSNRLADAISPYLRSHADNPVDWYSWGPEAFAAARQLDVPVLVSIGYSTCHWCHVMARESFSDPVLAEYLNAHFVSIKVDREEHPDVDASYLAAASAFTTGLGWPLNVFVTPEGRAFHAGTYFPPRPIAAPKGAGGGGHPSFRMVLEAVTDAWLTRRAAVTEGAAQVADALAESSRQLAGANPLPDSGAFAGAVAELTAYEDDLFGGFGGAPKFPVAPALGFLLDEPTGRELALRTLKRMGASPLRDAVEGGFFRYAVNRDWSEPHYERMLYDNAQLLELYTRAWTLTAEPWARTVAEGVADFLLGVLQLPGGGFASAQDSESTVAGQRVEGGYYALDVEARRGETPPALDDKILTGWNGLAIGALARAGFVFDSPSFTAAARVAADFLLDQHLRADGTLVRASVGGRASAAQATLEDFGMCARGLLELATVTGEVRYALAGRDLVNGTLRAPSDTAHGDIAHGDTAHGDPAQPDGAASAALFRAPNGPDPVLHGQGLVVAVDPSEGAYPSGLTATADASRVLYLLTAETRYHEAAVTALGLVSGLAPARPLAFGASLRLMSALTAPVEQLVIVSPDAGSAATSSGLLGAVRRRPAGLVASVTESQARAFADAGFELFAGRSARDGLPTAYLCRDFTCRLPVTDPAGLIGASAVTE